MIAWRYLRAKRAEGGVSVMTWISLVGITLAVAALIITLAVRSGFRYEFVDTILGANAHITVYDEGRASESGTFARVISDYDEKAVRLASAPGVVRAAPLVKGQVMATGRGRNAGVEVFGMREADFLDIRRVANPLEAYGDISRFSEGIAIGSGVARELGVGPGDRIRLISPNGTKTAFGTSPRVVAFEVVYVFRVGRFDIDRTRVYMPFEAAQDYFNREGLADEIEVILEDPEELSSAEAALFEAVGPGTILWTWRDSSGSGLIMLVKNKGRDIGILRTMGLSEGSILRVFFICGASTGVIGTIAGLILGCLFAIYIDPIFDLVNSSPP